MNEVEVAFDAVVKYSFYAAFVIDICILVYALMLSKMMDYSGALFKTTLFVGLSAFVFGLHHMGEVLLADMKYGLEISESIEGIAAVLLAIATYSIYTVSKGGSQ